MTVDSIVFLAIIRIGIPGWDRALRNDNVDQKVDGIVLGLSRQAIGAKYPEEAADNHKQIHPRLCS